MSDEVFHGKCCRRIQELEGENDRLRGRVLELEKGQGEAAALLRENLRLVEERDRLSEECELLCERLEELQGKGAK